MANECGLLDSRGVRFSSLDQTPASGMSSAAPPGTQVQRLMVSGTRAGMTAAQEDAFVDILRKHVSAKELLHGDCIGADAQCHRLARGAGERARRDGRDKT